ncbi:transcription initiation factor TFIID subunit 12 isoform X4 [Rosa chinensis]|uniref:transcription initiation factor TFIID subunit 12 isoform X4 n=1 Tax=Rosa chinensis TaxID=74649 RepID=UPI000D093693|nr:transcription initiation factor TFIID subunit 12 isoform X4 [Rosa chinensis]
MDPQNSTATGTPPIPSSSETPQLPPPQPQSQPQPPSSSASAPSTSAPIPPSPSPSPNPNPKPSTASLPPQSLPAPAHTRPPPTLNRPWPQPPHYSHHYPSPSSSASSVPPAPSVSGPPPRAGIAIGVPAHHPGPSPPQPTPYTSSYGHFGGIGRGGGVGVPEPSSNSNASQNFQGHNLSRASSLGSPSSPNTSQVLPLHNQPWLSGSQGKPPIPSSPYRQQMTSTSMLQRSHLPQPQQQQQQHHPLPTATQQQQQGPMPTASPQQHMPSVQHQQPSSSHQGHDHFGQQTQPSRIPQASPRQQQNSRVQVPVNQKSSPLAAAQPNTVQSAPQNRITSAETEEPCNRILSKRTIHDLVNQIDPSERLDPDVEDILMDIADEFVESITTFSCSLAKHRKSTTLEAKDILLHLEKNWNITLPGFGGDEIKGYRKPITNDIHKGRLAAIKKSMVATETANTRSTAGQATGNAKGGVKAPANISSQNIKMREVT